MSAITTMMTLCSTTLRQLEAIAAFCGTPTGNALQDTINQTMLSVLSSPNGSDVQERLLAEACGAAHKGDKKLGADALLGEDELEIKPSKSVHTTSSVNITDDTPSRLLKDLQTPSKKIAIGRCAGGKKFQWVVVCPMTDFAKSRYLAMCKHWNHPPSDWSDSLEEQKALVSKLMEVQGKNKYLRSSQLKFVDVTNVVGAWVHPDLETPTGRSAEAALIRRLRGGI